MKKELQEQLFSKYPKLFAQKDLSMSQTSMCFGICCGDGWKDLIDRLCQVITALDPEGLVQAVQVKEKFGMLRFYVGRASLPIFDAIDLAERASAVTCEECGLVLSSIRYDLPWYRTLCDEHYEETLAKMKKSGRKPRKL